jgi:hypothetical protein
MKRRLITLWVLFLAGAMAFAGSQRQQGTGGGGGYQTPLRARLLK